MTSHAPPRPWLPVLALVVVLAAPTRLGHADPQGDRAMVATTIDRLAETAVQLARTASTSDARAVRSKLAPRATDLADDLGELARRTRRDLGYDVLIRDTGPLIRDAAALTALADEADDKAERRALRGQASALEHGVATIRKAFELLASKRDEAKPARAARPTAMAAAAFERFRAAVSNETFDNAKLAIVQHAIASNWFSTNQVVAIMQLFSFDSGKIDAAAAMWPKIVDPDNSFAIYGQLDFDSSKDALRKRVGGR